MENGFCILRILDIFSACEVWFTFVYRKQEHLAVGSSEQGLTRSRGHPHFVVALSSPFVPLLYHTLRGLSRGLRNFFQVFSSSIRWFVSLGSQAQHGGSCLLLSPLDIISIPQTAPKVNW